MLDYLWAGMLLLGVVWGLVQGRAEELTQAVLDGGKDAVTLSITMLGVMSVWTGLMEVGQKGGLLRQVNRLLQPVISWLFPRLPKDHPAAESISANFAANLLGLGNAATPAALKAMKELQELQVTRTAKAKPVGRQVTRASGTESVEVQVTRAAGTDPAGVHDRIDIANDEMCTFLIINISSLQLVPINMIAYRSQYGAVSPAAITVPVLIATMVSTLVGVLFAKAMSRRRR